MCSDGTRKLLAPAVICSDKTGTLTTNQMSAVQLSTVADTTSMRSWTISGHTYSPLEGRVEGLVTLDQALEVGQPVSFQHTRML